MIIVGNLGFLGFGDEALFLLTLILLGYGGRGSGGAMEVALQTPTNESNQTLKDENTTTDSNTFVPQESNTTLQDRIIKGLGLLLPRRRLLAISRLSPRLREILVSSFLKVWISHPKCHPCVIKEAKTPA